MQQQQQQQQQQQEVVDMKGRDDVTTH